MILYFFRHGEAEEDSYDDFHRRLTGRGQKRTEAASGALKRLDIELHVIYSSPRVRARQTADILAAAIGLTVTQRAEVDIGFTPPQVSSLIQDLPDNYCVMFVGHNPSLSLIVSSLTGANVELKKGGCARVDLTSRQPLKGELVWLLTPKIFDMVAD